VSLRTYSTIKIGGSAEKILHLKDLANFSENLPAPIRILGNGSNVLIDDRDLKGTVIITRDFSNSDPKLLSDDKTAVLIQVNAGMYLPRLSSWAGKRGLSGCEYMIGVPGTVGGAILQNAGANEQEMKDILVSVEIFDLHASKTIELSGEECKLSYRHSALKDEPHHLVTSAILRLQKSEASIIEAQTELNLSYRKSKTPYAKPSLGSIYTRLKKGTDWIYPGKLIQDAQLKGERVGGAMVSPIHANYIVNEGGATFENVRALMQIVESRVFEHSGYHLQPEILVWSDRETF
jgi:UDP-N-acetylmuramate dehydrogenase